MPTSQQILANLAETVDHFWYVAVAWHLAILGLVLGLVFGWRPAGRTAGSILVAPMLSVALLALIAGSPFNAVVFLVLSVLSFAVARRLRTVPVHLGPRWQVIAGVAMIAFGWFYPHFVHGSSTLVYLYMAPTGLIPCPTLATIVGFSILFNGFGSRAWGAIVAFAGLFYGLFGGFRLGVHIDHVLTAGALALSVIALKTHGTRRTKNRAVRALA